MVTTQNRLTQRNPKILRGFCQRAGELMLDPATEFEPGRSPAMRLGYPPACSLTHHIDLIDDSGRVLDRRKRSSVALAVRGDMLRTLRPGCPPHEQTIAHNGVVVELLLAGPVAERLAEAVRTSPGSFGWTVRFQRVAGHLATTEESPPEAKGKDIAVVTGAYVHTVILTTDSAKVDRGTAGNSR